MRLQLENLMNSINSSLMTLLVTIAVVLSLFGCSSAPNSTSYYLLNNQVSASAINQQELAGSPSIESEKATVLLSVQLADYLNSPYLVMQINQHKIEYATFHMWAEPLADSSFNALLSDLNLVSTTLKFKPEPQFRGTKANEQAELLVQINYFHVTAQSKVILSGRYEYKSHKGADLDVSQNDTQAFSFESPLQQDGYSDSVAQMRDLVTQLAKQIASNVAY
ncbi:ABC-type transport auxiliary lipoprotein family protein [Shewanella sp. D64]|uniref:PqiC family protein n=1 Tax=unclassified Shewanella TaxID=196818 RepID=UPI0022BA3AA9|nr:MULTISPECIES: ABC-type transport auxiliary lipoprotein family protein [unclassified Shewanella]MEC4724908.1 ABC-type transport auxiliary lipoprotein family protein [Shewanella sp. D64]MEC4736299.1 ABC-type transport auxiliary lipoprotein family protein [Shewanella sp. E94]WBJ97638.1 ABC-type transport auxiliary lipoprotein family protein [Shewanella sp. MTB7]